MALVCVEQRYEAPNDTGNTEDQACVSQAAEDLAISGHTFFEAY